MISEISSKNDCFFTRRIETDSFPEDLKNRNQWIVAQSTDKKPILPWTPPGTTDWNDPANQTDFETAKAATELHDDRELGFVFREKDPFVFLDFDDARDPETECIDPAVAALIDRIDSYTDLSKSGTGLHVIVRGSLPEETKAVSGPIGDDGATLEVYDHNRYGVMTGNHLVSTPSQCHDREGVITEVADEYRSIPQNIPDKALEEPSYDREQIEQVEQTNDLDQIWSAVKQTRTSEIRLRSRVTEERSDGTKSLYPSWDDSDSGTRIGQFDDGFVNRDGMVGMDVLQMVAREEGIIQNKHEYPQGEDYIEAVDALRDRGAQIPEYQEPNDREFEFPAVEDLLDQSLADLRERARENGSVWPTTEELRNRLGARIEAQFRNGSSAVIEAPTASGKTHQVATTGWREKEVTGDAPVIHLSKTRDARQEAYEMSEEAGVDTIQLRAGEESCPVAEGQYDGDSHTHPSVDALVDGDQTASDWLRIQVETKGIPFARAHGELEWRYQDCYDEPLPCCRGEPCQSHSQWDAIRPGDDIEADKDYDVIHATHQFAHISGFIDGANVVFDEQPEFTIDAEDARIQSAIASFLQVVDAPKKTWEDFVTVALSEDQTILRQKLREAVERDPPDDWYLDDPDAHLYAPAIARALVDAERTEHQRYVGEVRYQPFYRGGDDRKNGMERVMVVLNERYEFELVKAVPPLQDARCVLGLDAHPSLERWQLDTLPSMQSVSILSEDERRNWRRFERGLLVVQIGDADRPLTRAANFPESKTEALIGELVDRFPGLQTAITSKAVKDEVEQLLPDSELSEPVLHYNNELSRNDFAGEDIGLLVGCIDPGDHNVLSWLALHDAQAAPARSDEECGDCDGEGCYDCLGTGKQRALGRDFEGPDAEAAEALLASVREFHVAQSIGRYAREADQPEEFTVVFVWTAAVPEELVDLKIPDLRSLTQTQQEIVRCVEQSPEPVPTREVSDELDITKETARQTLAELAEAGPVTVHEGAGKHGAHLYDIDREVSGFLTLGDSDGSE